MLGRSISVRREATWIGLAIALALALQLPSLGAGFYADDYVHQLVLGDGIAIPSLQPWSLFDFGEARDWPTDDNPPWTLNWWTSPDFKGRFFRPLTSLTLWLDHALYHGRPLGYHVTSLLWYLAVLLLVAALYRALGLDRATTALAIVLFAGTNGATLPVGWVSNRNTLVAAVLVLAAVLVTVRGRGRWRLPVAFVLALAAVGGKESGVLGFALIAAWQLLAALRARRPDDRRRALMVAGAAAGAAMAVICALAVAGFGTRSMFYATPWQAPGRYLTHLAVLATAGGLRLLTPVSLDLVLLNRSALPIAMVGGAAAVAAAVVVFRRSVTSHPAAPFLAAWIVLALLPQGGVMPSDRLLLDAAIASAALLAVAVIHILRAGPAAPRRQRVAAWFVVVSAGALGAAFTAVQATAIASAAGELRAAIVATDPGPPAAGVADAVVLQSGNAMLAFSLVSTWAVETGRRDIRFTLVHLGGLPLEWRRDGDRTCVVSAGEGVLLASPFEQVFRSGPDPPKLGVRYRTAAMEVEPVAVGEDGLRAVRLTFQRSLDDPLLRFLVPDASGLLRPLPAPAIGETVVLPRAVPAVPVLP